MNSIDDELEEPEIEDLDAEGDEELGSDEDDDDLGADDEEAPTDIED
jgi:hypothetical protein